MVTTGDPSARARLIELHLPLVRALARRYAHCGEQLEDLVQVGSIGLIEAVDRFDPDRGGDLVRFAAPTICGEIKLRIQQNLLSNAAALGDVRKVYSHAQSLAQCVQWLARRP